MMTMSYEEFEDKRRRFEALSQETDYDSNRSVQPEKAPIPSSSASQVPGTRSKNLIPCIESTWTRLAGLRRTEQGRTAEVKTFPKTALSQSPPTSIDCLEFTLNPPEVLENVPTPHESDQSGAKERLWVLGPIEKRKPPKGIRSRF